MANAVEQLTSLILSAGEISKLTGWPDEMVEDYLTIIRNLAEVASIVDENELNIFDRIEKVENNLFSILLTAAKQKSLINSAYREIDKYKQLLTDSKINAGKLSAKINSLRNEVVNFIPIKACMCSFEGAGASDPTILTDYNVGSLARAGTGVYRLTLSQNTMYSIDISVNGIPSLQANIAPSAGTDLFSTDLTEISTGVYDIKVYEVIQGAGNQLDYVAYDIIAGDKIGLTILLNAGTGELPPE